MKREEKEEEAEEYNAAHPPREKKTRTEWNLDVDERVESATGRERERGRGERE